MGLDPTLVRLQVQQALLEDLGSGDITASLVPPSARATARLITREPMIFCGEDFVREVFRQVDPDLVPIFHKHDGEAAPAHALLLEITGKARSLLSAERTALNFIQMLSGTATLTHRYVEALQGTSTTLLDTRKTIPLFRLAQKYAVRCGGGTNHRIGLFDAFLIKENHILACGSITRAIESARAIAGDKPIEVEVETLAELGEAIAAHADIVMLDNFSPEDIGKAVAFTQKRVKLEVSGNVDLNTIRSIAAYGVDFISVGHLTRDIQAIDLSMRFYHQ